MHVHDSYMAVYSKAVNLMCTVQYQVIAVYFYIYSDGEHDPHHLCLVTYHFGFVPEIKPHGNSTIKKEPFHPTWSSTKQQIRQKCVDTGPKQVVAFISAIAGGVLGASAPGQLPRDKKKVTNFKAREVLLQDRVLLTQMLLLMTCFSLCRRHILKIRQTDL